MLRWLRLCPLHEFERWCCDSTCVDARAEFQRISAAYRTYWSQRRLGVKPRPAKKPDRWDWWRAA